MRIAVCLGNWQLDALAGAALSLGLDTIRFVRYDVPVADVVVLWNGVDHEEYIKDHPGQRFLFVEHGWTNQAESIQVDHLGVNGRASWATEDLIVSKRVPIQPPTGEAFLVTLQWDDDSQIKDDYLSPVFHSMAEMLAFLEENLDRPMLVRGHPKYPASEKAAEIVERCPRMSWDKGSLDDSIRSSRAVVLVNSTCGFHALRKFKPVITFGRSVYGSVAGAVYPMAGWKDGGLAVGFRQAVDDVSDSVAGLNAVAIGAACARIRGKEWWSNRHLPFKLAAMLGIRP